MTPASRSTATDRARGALFGLAIGDALGMPAEGLSLSAVRERYGVVDQFRPSPADHPISGGRAAGQVTDDTDQAVIVARLLVAGAGRLDPLDLARELLAWEARLRAEGSHDLLGPSTQRALARIADGVPPDESGRDGDTNGAAMRIAPVGICRPVDADGGGLAELVEAVALVSRATHNTGLAIAGAAAVAAAVSAGVAGLGLPAALRLSVDAARLGATYGAFAVGADVASRIAWAAEMVSGRSPEDAVDVVDQLVGTSVATQESVPAALALASLMTDDPWPVVRAAASLGGDSDTIAAMAGAVCGSVVGVQGFPEMVRAQVTAANPALDLAGLADALAAVRRGR